MKLDKKRIKADKPKFYMDNTERRVVLEYDEVWYRHIKHSMASWPMKGRQRR